MMKTMKPGISIMLLLMVAACLLSTPALASPWGTDVDIPFGDPITGERSNLLLGVTATGDWSQGFTISWQVEQRDDGLWDYTYMIATAKHDVSHFILEVTEGGDFEYTANGRTEGPTEWSASKGNPEMPNSIYGIKFDFRKGPYTITTDRGPVWGVFYCKDGTSNYAWSSALDFSDYRTNEGLTTDDFIIRPNGCYVPIPGAFWLLASSLLGFVGIRKKLEK